jgi:hypothetical protein
VAIILATGGWMFVAWATTGTSACMTITSSQHASEVCRLKNDVRVMWSVRAGETCQSNHQVVPENPVISLTPVYGRHIGNAEFAACETGQYPPMVPINQLRVQFQSGNRFYSVRWVDSQSYVAVSSRGLTNLALGLNGNLGVTPLARIIKVQERDRPSKPWVNLPFHASTLRGATSVAIRP